MKKIAILIFVLSLFAMMTGCGSTNTVVSNAAAPAPNAAAPAPNAAAPAAPVTTAAVPSSGLDAQNAKQTALQAVGVSEDSAVFTKVWKDFDDGMQEWEIEFVSNGQKYEIDLNAADGSVRKSSCEPVERGIAAVGCISADEAKAAALQAAGISAEQATFIDVESDFDDGMQIWELKFIAPDGIHEIELNAANGSILEMSLEMAQIAQ